MTSSESAPVYFVIGMFFMALIIGIGQYWFMPSAYMKGIEFAESECRLEWENYWRRHPEYKQ